MTLINQSSPTRDDALVLLGNKTPCLALPKPWAKNKSTVFFFGLWLLTGHETVIAQLATTQSLASSVNSEILNIHLKGNRLSIEAKQVPWQQLLTKLEEKTQISIQSAKPIESTVTVSIHSLPVNEALQQLFNHRFDSVFLFSEQKAPNSTMPKTVWLLGNPINVAKASSHSVKQTNDMAKPAPKPDKAAAENASILNSNEHETVQELVDKARNEENPELRIQALASLSGRQEQADKSAEKLALETALDDKEASVRQYAVQALASQGGQSATEHLREALDDPDAGVRMQAVESVALEGQGIALLQDALSNPDELVQTIAEERLKQVNK